MKPKTIRYAVVLSLLIQLLIAASALSPEAINFESTRQFESSNLVYGDAYANAFDPDRSLWFSDGENAIGAPDGQYAQIFMDYSSGYLTLDMGEQEDIVNGPGDDFTVISRGGNYSVFLQPTYESSPSLLARANGTQSFDLNDIGMDQARYVRVEHFVGDTVELDAIEAINYNAPTSDIYDPLISGPDDLWVWSNQSHIQLEWEVSDDTPNNYTVLVNGSAVQEESWDGSDVLVSIANPGAGFWNVTLLLYDLSGNWASDSVILEVRAVSVPVDLLLIGGIALGGVLIVVVVLYFLKMRRN
ncbi:MAG: hypothetical protein ACW974_02070 [Candidatus Thorarchaeota archaeon]|jgi:hypothetical protein